MPKTLQKKHRIKSLDDNIEEYLKNPTDYAFLLTGQWGTGKTYYWDNILATEVVNKTSFIDDHSKNFKAVRVSLFGVSSLDDLQSRIFFSIYPFWKKRLVTIGASAAKILLRATLKIKYNIKDFDKYLSDINEAAVAYSQKNNLVLCFDDIERKNEKFSIKEIASIINDLVENNDTKVILITNEDKIEEENYKELKEKIIGITYEFPNVFESSFDSLVNYRFSGYPTFEKFVHNHKETILSIFQAAELTNLRVLHFYLNKLHRVYSVLSTSISEDLTSEIWLIRLKSIVAFSAAVAIDFQNNQIPNSNEEINRFINLKHGPVSFYPIPGLKDIFDQASEYMPDGADKEEVHFQNKERYADTFLMKYQSVDWPFYIYPSILEFIRGISSNFITSLNIELEEAFPSKDTKYKEEYKLLEGLSDYKNVLELSDSEFTIKTKQLIKYLIEDRYDLESVLRIFALLEPYQDVLHCRLNSDIFENAIDNYFINKQGLPVPGLSPRLFVANGYAVSDQFGALVDYAEEQNKKFGEKLNEKLAHEWLSLIEKSPEDFFSKYSAGKEDFNSISFFALMPIDRLVSSIANFPPSLLEKLLSLFTERYWRNEGFKRHSTEQDFIHKLDTEIARTINKQGGTSLKKHFLMIFKRHTENMFKSDPS